MHQVAVHAALPNSTIISVSADSQRWPSPYVAIDLEQVTLLVRETNLTFLVEASFLEIICKPATVSVVFGWILLGAGLTFRCRPSVPT